MKVADDFNEYGTPVSWHLCQTCGYYFSLCPAVSYAAPGWNYCMADECASYDPDRDADILFMSDKEIAEQKPIVSMKMLEKRKAGVERCQIVDDTPA